MRTDEEKLALANKILAQPASTWAERKLQLDLVLSLDAEVSRQSIEDRIARGENVYR